MIKSLRHSGSRIGTSGTDTNWNWQKFNGCIVWCSSLLCRRSLVWSDSCVRILCAICMHVRIVQCSGAVIMYVHVFFFCMFHHSTDRKVCLCQQCQLEWFANISLDYLDLVDWCTCVCSCWRSSSQHRVPHLVPTHAILHLSVFHSTTARVYMVWWRTCVCAVMCAPKAQESSAAHLASAAQDWSACKDMKKGFRKKIYGIIHRSASILLHQVSCSRL